MSPAENSFGRIYDVLFDERRTWPRPSFPFSDGANISSPEIALRHKNGSSTAMAQAGCALERIQNRADIDISGPESNFVRSIRVFDVRSVYQDESGPAGDEECKRSARIYLGTYGTQGDFSWTRSSPAALPSAHVGLEQWGSNCPRIYHRSVFVEWRDYDGDYGFEQVNY